MTQVQPYKLKAVFFDIDNTLVPTTRFTKDARSKAFDALVDAMKRYRTPIRRRKLTRTFNQVVKKLGSNSDGHFNTLMEKMHIPSNLDWRFIARAVISYHNSKQSYNSVPEAPFTLDELKKNGYKTYALSEGDRGKQAEKIVRCGLDFFLDDAFMTGLDLKKVAYPKDKPFYERILKEVGLDGEDCLMVGDRIGKDVSPARACGMYTARVLMGCYKNGIVAEGEEADYKIKSIEEVLRIIPLIEKAKTDRLNSLIAKAS